MIKIANKKGGGMKSVITVSLFVVFMLCATSFASLDPTEQPIVVDAKSTTEMLIVVDTKNHRLYLYEKLGCCEEILTASYPIASPRKGVARPHGEGFVTDIIKNPWWYPTEKTKKAYRKKGITLPDAIPPGDKRNAMGTAKLILSYETPEGCIYRIHGTPDEDSIGQDASRGCIRMKNKDVKQLAKAITVGTRVVIN